MRSANRHHKLGRAVRGHMPRLHSHKEDAVTGRARPTYDPWRDGEGAPITVECRVQQIGIAREDGALKPRLHKQGEVTNLGGQEGRGFRLRVLLDEKTEPTTIRPHLLRVVNP
jgi:hypothetical protein